MLDGELDREVAHGRDQERLEEIGRRPGRRAYALIL
jgi:hypothetical protein